MSFHPASLWIQKNSPGRGRFSPVTNPAPDSGAYHTDEAVYVLLGVEQMGRDANPPLAHAHDNIFLSQPLIKLGSFLQPRLGRYAPRS
jgi:hypothetical protein